MPKTISVVCGTCRHPQPIPLSAIASIEDDTQPGGYNEFACLRLKPRRWIKDTYGDGQWHGTAIAERKDVAPLLFPKRGKLRPPCYDKQQEAMGEC